MERRESASTQIFFPSPMLVWLIQLNPTVRSGKDFFHGTDCVGLHHNHRWFPGLHGHGKSPLKFFRRSHPFGSKTKRASDTDEVGTLQIHADSLPVEVRVLDISEHS